MKKILMTAAFALAATTAPVIAQTTGQSGSMGSGSMQSGAMQNGMGDSSMSASSPKMSKSQMAAMKRCQASAKAMKTKSCMKMQKMNPGMSSSGTM